MRIACISDVHEQWKGLNIPDCDVLISSGDYSYRGKPNIVMAFHKWLGGMPFKHIISCQGNHEVWPYTYWQEAKDIANEVAPRVHFVQEETLVLDGVKFHCSAVTPEFNHWAWNVKRGEPIRRHWDAIPDDTDVLVTHGPPFGILDRSVLRVARHTDESLGCVDLRERIKQLKKLQMHQFGHIHGSSGIEVVDGVTFINASICDEFYKPTNPVRIYDLKETTNGKEG